MANPFDQFDEAPTASAPNPFDRFDAPQAQSQPITAADISKDQQVRYDAALSDTGTSGRIGAFARGAEEGALPAAGGIVGAGTGMAAVAPLAAAASAVATPLAGAAVELAGGIVGGFGGASAVGAAQKWVLDHAPDGVVKALGLDAETAAQDDKDHPNYRFAGQLAPNLLAFRPGAMADAATGTVKTTAEKLMANPVTARALPAAVMGAQEAATEEVQNGDLDPSKIAIAAGVGALSNRMTRVGHFLTGAGAGPVLGLQQALRNRGQGGEPDPATMRDITPEKPGPAPAGTPRLEAPIDPQDIHPGDEESPIDTSLIAAGRKVVREATAKADQPAENAAVSQPIDSILNRNGWPQPGSKVTLDDGEGPAAVGTVHSGFSTTHPDTGMVGDGLHVTLDSGEMFSAFKHEIDAAGITITPAQAQMAGLPADVATQSAPASQPQAPAPMPTPAAAPVAETSAPAQVAPQAVTPEAPPAPIAPAQPTTGTGTQASPIVATHADHVEQASKLVNTAPTEAQKEAGNYTKGHITVQGLPISIENPKGSVRSGQDADGTPWSVEMPAAYGYIKRTTGADAEHVDVYVGPNPQSPKVFVIDQKDAGTGAFDEHKSMVGFDTKEQAVTAYHAAFSDGKGPDRIGGVREMNTLDFKKLVNSGVLDKPVAGLAAPEPSASLPAHLAGAAPRYNYGPKAFTLNFSDDIDKASYIAAQKMPSKHDAAFVAHVTNATGMDEAQVRAHGAVVRDAIKAQAVDAKPGALTIPAVSRQTATPTVTSAPTPAAPIIQAGGVITATRPAATTATPANALSIADKIAAKKPLKAPENKALLDAYFAQGRTVEGYGGKDVVSTPPAWQADGRWTVGVRGVGTNGALQPERFHSTYPDRAKLLAFAKSPDFALTTTTPVVSAPRAPAQAHNETSALQFIRAMGGIKTTDAQGKPTKEGQDIAAVLQDVKRPGLINNQTGQRPDTIREHMKAQGWFGANPEHGNDIQALYDLMGKELHEGPQYHPESEKGRSVADGAVDDQNAQALEDVHHEAKKAGEDLTPAEADQILANMGEHGIDPESAVAEHIERKAMRELYEHHGETADQAYADAIPFHGGEGKDDRWSPESGQGLAVERDRTGTESEARSPAAGHPDEAFHTEVGAQGLKQSIVPGGEASATQLAKAREAQGHGRATTDVAQKDAGGLFGTPEPEVRDLFAGHDPAPKIKATPAPAAHENPVAQAVRKHLATGMGFESITQARAMAASVLGEPVGAGTPAAKKAEEAMELGVVLAARDIVSEGGSKIAIYDKLVDLYARQPTFGTRSSTSMEQQAYSTPMPLAFLADYLAGLDHLSTVYEPTAGNGALLLTASPHSITANELNPDRAAALRSSLPGATITSHDASVTGPKAKAFDVVIANPPFGVVKDDSGTARNFKVDDRYSTNEIDHAIAIKALEAMADDGRAVLIVGSVNKLTQGDARSDAYNGKAKKQFYLTLYGAYNVTDHFTVAGELYGKQGAGWPVDVITIDGRGKSGLRVPAADVPRQYKSWDGLKEVFSANGGKSAARLGEADGGHSLEGSGPGAGDEGNRGVGGVGRPGDGSDALGDGQPGELRPVSLGGKPAGRELAERPAGEHAEPADRIRPVRPAGRAGLVEGEAPPSQVPYQPSSSSKGLDTLVPYNMRDAIQASLDTLADRLHAEGKTIDTFVAEKLGYKNPADIGKYLSAEQVDAVGLAIDNMDKGAGFILGDQTGVGKGRVVASVIRYAIKSKRTPIFVTEKPNLYADMYRDLTDTGIKELLGRDVRMLMTNSGESIPLTDDGKTKLTSGTKLKHDALLTRAGNSADLEGHDVVFTTYNQMQTIKGVKSLRMDFLEKIAPGAIIVLDESHNAGGAGADSMAKGMPESRASFVRKIAALAHGVTYSSATYAKRPDVMDLYATTDMKLAVADISKLAEAIAKGGVPMQQVVANMLAQAGQYIRREKSFAGITYNTPSVQVDRAVYDRFSSILNAVQRFSEDHVKAAVKEVGKALKAEGENVGYDGATGAAGASSTSFGAVMHNLVEQMLLSIKAERAAETAIAAIKRGEKPVITVANTMESFLADFAATEGTKVGEPVDLDFSSLLHRYLERTRTLTLKKPWSKDPATKHYLTNDQLGTDGVAAYRKAQQLIASTDLSSLPVSPIDHIRYLIKQAGHNVSEITGRSLTMDYAKGGAATLGQRPDSERSTAGKRRAIAGFNDGTLDALIINQSGATGLSLHASEKFKDQRKRRMIIAQAERNIDTHMQMLGRVNRTGQVNVPEYDQMVADVPAEKRPAAVLAKKMASLNANTTATRTGAMTAKDVPDFMNDYGDEVAVRAMSDMPELHELLDNPIKTLDSGALDRDGAMRKLTGRIPLLPIQQQEDLYELLEGEYAAALAQKEAAGENTLEAKTVDLDAKPVSTAQVVGAVGDSNSPFAAAVNLEHLDVKRVGKPMPGKMVIERTAESLGATDPFQHGDDLQKALFFLQTEGKRQSVAATIKGEKAFDAYSKELVGDMESGPIRDKMVKRLADTRDRWTRMMFIAHVGTGVKLMSEQGNIYGVVTDLQRSGEARNPLALGTWKLTFALADAARTITIPMSQLDTGADPAEGTIVVAPAKELLGEPLIEAFDNMQSQSRERRQMITGNLLAGFDHVKGKGSIINYTTANGDVAQGILMSRDYDHVAQQLNTPVQFRSADQALAHLAQGKLVVEKSESVVLSKTANGQLRIITPQAKGIGGKYYLNKGVLAAVGGDFVSVGGMMRAEVPMSGAKAAVEALQRAGAVLQAKTEDREAALKATVQTAEKPALQRRQDQTMASTGVTRDEIYPGLHLAFTPKAAAQRAALASQLRAWLDSRNLQKVGVRVADAIENSMDGGPVRGEDAVFLARIVNIALDGKNPAGAMTHEVIHALRRMGFFTVSEWAALEQEAKVNWIDRYREKLQGYRDDELVEEAVAFAHQEWSGGRTSRFAIINRIFSWLRDAFDKIRSVFSGRGLHTAEDVFGANARRIFESVESGEVGAGGPASDLERPSFQHRDDEASPGFDEAWSGAIAAAARKLGWEGEPTSRAMFAKALLTPKGPAKTELTRNAGLIKAMEDQRSTPFMRQQAPLHSATGDEKVRGLAQGIEDKADASFDKPTYNQQDQADQMRRANAFVKTDYKAAIEVAMGRAPEPYGVMAQAVMIAVENRAAREGDSALIQQLATNSGLLAAATEHGQRSSIFQQRNPTSPVTAIQDVLAARATAKKITPKAKTAAVDAMLDEIRKKTQKTGRKLNWEQFINSIVCSE